MKNCKIFLIDTPQDLTLIKEIHLLTATNAISHYFTSISDAKRAMNNEPPDLILIGSGKLIEDFEFLAYPKDIPIVVLCESDGFDVILKNSLYNVLFVTRPFDMDDIPEVFNKVLEFWSIQRRRGHNV